ncbi:glycosyltransferase [Marinobacter salicampi]|uniref:glycosyltransferase n=1 Tax=Marinobacter salicampi TaxID=435907 RepID=UPI00140CCB8C|nr:glycosyltransferase [Marinobacter salicampi]
MEKAQRHVKALVTLAVGDFYTQMGDITHSLMQDYAERCGVDFIVIQDRKVNENYGLDERYEKFQLYDLIDKYDQIVFVDTDILVSPKTPSLFDLVPVDRFAAVSEAAFSKAGRDIRLTQEILGEVNWRNYYFNSGVMVFSKAHKSVFDPKRDELRLWSTGDFRKKEVNLLNDQPYLNHRINELGIDLFELGHEYNHTRVITETHTRFKSYMIHYAGPSGHRYGSRLEQLHKDFKVFTNPMSLNLSAALPPYRWVVDRFDPAFVRYLFKEKFARKS